MTVVEKLIELRALMAERGIDVYMIPTSDFHETEYVGEHFKARYFMSGFSGSQGTLVVCKGIRQLYGPMGVILSKPQSSWKALVLS